jgi:uncharacterized membrane protein YphA (DoxX/SURF4 family)
MNIALWIVQGLLAVAFGGAGFLKLTKPKEELRAQMAYVDDFSARTVKLIGAAELLAALGLILPWATGILPVLTPLAACGLVLIMVLAALTHVRRKEYPAILFNAVLGGLALLVALNRF